MMASVCVKILSLKHLELSSEEDLCFLCVCIDDVGKIFVDFSNYF